MPNHSTFGMFGPFLTGAYFYEISLFGFGLQGSFQGNCHMLLLNVAAPFLSPFQIFGWYSFHTALCQCYVDGFLEVGCDTVTMVPFCNISAPSWCYSHGSSPPLIFQIRVLLIMSNGYLKRILPSKIWFLFGVFRRGFPPRQILDLWPDALWTDIQRK